MSESILNSTHVPWTTILPHRQPPPNDSPPNDELVVVLARRRYSSLKHWVDDLNEKFHQLLHILGNAPDLARSPHGWVFLHSLKRYSGRAIPGNWDAHTDTIVHTNTFSLFSSGRPLTLDRDLLCAMVAFDDSRRRYRFTLGEAPDSNRKTSLVIAASSLLPAETFNESHPQTGPRQVLPSTLPRPALPKFGVYFCQIRIFRKVDDRKSKGSSISFSSKSGPSTKGKGKGKGKGSKHGSWWYTEDFGEHVEGSDVPAAQEAEGANEECIVAISVACLVGRW